jgi:hypothetical protein
MLESEIADLRLLTLEAIARENSAHNRRVDAELEGIKCQIKQFLHRCVKSDMSVAMTNDIPVNPVGGGFVTPADAGGASSTASRCGEGAAHMCDYCFTFSANCFACPSCGREWYCSATCQRLRHRCHAGRCRACAHQQLGMVEFK